jgi:hypothetical protein
MTTQWPDHPIVEVLMVVSTALIQLAGQFLVTRLPELFPERLTLTPLISRKTIVTIVAVVVLLVAQLAEVAVWAVRYLVWGELGSFTNAFYFSLASFTTVGANELTLSPAHRLIGAIEAAMGMLMFGWSTALLVNVIQRTDRPGDPGL